VHGFLNAEKGSDIAVETSAEGVDRCTISISRGDLQTFLKSIPSPAA
jgi:hypothetical protein